MSRRIITVLSAIVAATIGYGVAAHAQTSGPAPGYMYASCTTDGKLGSARSHATGCKRTGDVRGTARYIVSFDRSVQNCAFLATPGRPDETGTFVAQLSVNLAKGDPKSVGVTTAWPGGPGHSFMLAVLC